jgi:uncharacterized protein with NRDE domain
MCLVYFALNNHPIYKLIVLANRDEFYNRKAIPAGFWPEDKNIIGGQDTAVYEPGQYPGTWLGLTKKGRVAFLTNYRDLKNIKINAPSRGQLVSGFLASSFTAEKYLNNVSNIGQSYNGFNLVTGIGDHFYYFSNIQNDIKKLDNGIYGLSNHLLDTPWTKLRLGKNNFEQYILSRNALDTDHLLDIMIDETQATDIELPDTGIGIEKERMLSSIFIRSTDYGTRNTTLILVDRNYHVTFIERTYFKDPSRHNTLKFEFKIDD